MVKFTLNYEYDVDKLSQWLQVTNQNNSKDTNVNHTVLSKLIENDIKNKKDVYKIYAWKDNTSVNTSIQYSNTSNVVQSSKIIEYKVAVKNTLSQKNQDKFQDWLQQNGEISLTSNANALVQDLTHEILSINDVSVVYTTKNELSGGAIFLIVFGVLICCVCVFCVYIRFKDKCCVDEDDDIPKSRSVYSPTSTDDDILITDGIYMYIHDIVFILYPIYRSS